MASIFSEKIHSVKIGKEVQKETSLVIEEHLKKVAGDQLDPYKPNEVRHQKSGNVLSFKNRRDKQSLKNG